MKFLRFAFLPTLGALMLLVGVMGPASASLSRVPTSTPDAVSASGEALEDQIMVEVNAARSEAGLKPIRFFDSCVDRMASSWSRRIASSGVLAHRDQNKILLKCDQNWSGEALIRGEGLTARAMVDAWLASPPHRDILLKSLATRAGMAVVIDTQGRQVGVLNMSDTR